MEVTFTKKAISFEKVLNHLDELVIGVTSVLNEAGADYVVISGYVAILFGRSRSSEDIDLFLRRMDPAAFTKVWDMLTASYDCINASSADEAFESLGENVAIRFAQKGKAMPNVEMKFEKRALDAWTLDNKVKVVLNGKEFFISPIEVQIAFKLRLGSEKDIEDARYLHGIFKEHLDKALLQTTLRQLRVQDQARRYL